MNLLLLPELMMGALLGSVDLLHADVTAGLATQKIGQTGYFFMIAQAPALMGARPRFDSYGRLAGAEGATGASSTLRLSPRGVVPALLM